MDTPGEMLQKIQALVDRTRIKFEAYSFILSALHYVMTKVTPPRHISGHEFCEGISEYAIDQFGPMARTVLEFWGIHETLDFGRLVFDLVEIGLMRKTDEDSLDDFKEVYDFKQVFSNKVIFDT